MKSSFKFQVSSFIFLLFIAGCTLSHNSKYGTISITMSPDEISRLYEIATARDGKLKVFGTKDGYKIQVDNEGMRYPDLRLVSLSPAEVLELWLAKENGLDRIEYSGLDIRIAK